MRALQERLAGQGRTAEVLWVGTAAGLEARVAPAEGIRFAPVATGKLRRSSNPLKLLSPTNLKDMARVPLGAVQARRLIAEFRPDAVLATGGYVAVPVGLAARSLRVPLVVHEQTVRLGLANKVLARAATRVAVSSPSTLPLLPGSARRTAAVTGNPVRPAVLAGQAEKAVAALDLYGFDRALPTVYVTGGAQGSVQINTLVTGILPWLLERANVVHQCGPANEEAARAAAAALPPGAAARYLPTGYLGAELPDVLALADVVVSRSGAGTLAELTALGKAAVFVPLATSAGDEQVHNATHLQQSGAATALLGQVAPDHLRSALAPLLEDPERRAAMAARSREHGRPDAARQLVDVLLSVVGQR